jgi:hypothetical protein
MDQFIPSFKEGKEGINWAKAYVPMCLISTYSHSLSRPGISAHVVTASVVYRKAMFSCTRRATKTYISSLLDL